MSAIRTEGIGKVYGGAAPLPGRPKAPTVALEDLSIEVREGEIFGFLGPNGSGKSTLIRLLLGFLRPTTGRAEVLGLDVVRRSVEVRRRIGYLPGGIELYDGMTGRRLLDHLANLSGRPSVLRQELCERLGFPAGDLERPVRDLSRGMRQKLGIVQALQHDPELAILDEPSEGLDPLVQLSFYGLLEDRRAAGRTVFFSSHVLSEVERVCDRVAIVREGRLVALEDVPALLAHRTRRATMRIEGDLPLLEGIPGVRDVEVAGDRMECRLEGDVRPFLAAIRDADVRDLLIEPASLEEAFLEFYADDLAAARGVLATGSGTTS